jgi:hypothetical protein
MKACDSKKPGVKSGRGGRGDRFVIVFVMVAQRYFFLIAITDVTRVDNQSKSFVEQFLRISHILFLDTIPACDPAR